MIFRSVHLTISEIGYWLRRAALEICPRVFSLLKYGRLGNAGDAFEFYDAVDIARGSPTAAGAA